MDFFGSTTEPRSARLSFGTIRDHPGRKHELNQRGRISRTHRGELTDDDLDVVEGIKDQLVGRLQERKGIARDKAEREVNEWANSL